MKKNKIVIIIEGGCLQSVYSENPDDIVELIDMDNVKDEGDKAMEIADKAIDDADKSMYCIF